MLHAATEVSSAAHDAAPTPSSLCKTDRKMKFNYRDASRIRALRRRRIPDERIAEIFGGMYSKADMDWLVNEIKARNAKYRKENTAVGINRWEIQAENRPEIPSEVITRREHRVMLRPKTITALVFGDPLPGESALDRRFA